MAVKSGSLNKQEKLTVNPQGTDGESTASARCSLSVSRGILAKTIEVEIFSQGGFIGSAVLLLKDCLRQASQVCLKLSDDQTMSQASLDILVSSRCDANLTPVQGLPLMGRDLLNKQADEELAASMLQGLQLKLTPHEREVQLEDQVVAAVARQAPAHEAEQLCALQRVAERVLIQGSPSSKTTLTKLTRVVQSLREIASSVPGVIQDL